VKPLKEVMPPLGGNSKDSVLRLPNGGAERTKSGNKITYSPNGHVKEVARPNSFGGGSTTYSNGKVNRNINR
jgi:hypothetical protein